MVPVVDCYRGIRDCDGTFDNICGIIHDIREITMWQDPALMAVGFIFTIMLIPQLNDARNGKAIMNFWTCLITGLGCITIGGIDITLNLPMAAVVSVTTGLMWLGLLYYSEENRKIVIG